MSRCQYWLRIAGLWFLTLPAACPAHAQGSNYPDRPVTVISDAAAGSTPDVDTRFVAEGLSQIWGRQVVVINHPGANGSIAARAASGAAPDGYTLFMPAAFDIRGAADGCGQSSAEIAARFSPDRIHSRKSDVCRGEPRAQHHLAPAAHCAGKKRAGKDLHRGDRHRAAHALDRRTLADAGRYQAACGSLYGRPGARARGCGRRPGFHDHRGLFGHRRRGECKVGQSDRGCIAGAPAPVSDLPTVAETIPGFSATGWQILVAPIGTPEPIIRKVSDDLRQVVTDQDFKKRLGNIGSYSRAMSPIDALAFVQKEQQTWLPVLERFAGK